MSTEEPQQDAPVVPEVDSQMQEAPTAPALGRKRPRLDLNALAGGERKRGKSMFGVLVNTLNKAKAEDKERNASEAAKKRQLIEQRLLNKLKKETDSVRKVEEVRKDKVTASRKEEELQLKDSIFKLRRTLLPQLSNFLLTSDIIPDHESESDSPNPIQLSSALPARSHPPPLYYLPKLLTPSQEAFLSKRKEQIRELAEKDWEGFKAERTTGVEEITSLRQKVAEQEEQKKLEREKARQAKEAENGAAPVAPVEPMEDDQPPPAEPAAAAAAAEPHDAEMEVDDGLKDDREPESEKKDERVAVGGDDDDAVEY